MNIPATAMPFSYVNGAIIPSRQAVVSAFDRGFLVADGIFETFHVVGNVPLSFSQHLDRLWRSAAFMRLEIGLTRTELTAAVIRLCLRNQTSAPSVPESALRMTVSRGVSLTSPATVSMFMRRLTPAHLSKRHMGVSLWTLPYTRDAISDLAQHKTLSYLASSLGQVLIAEKTDDPRSEGLFVTTDGHVLEGSSSNVFIVDAEGLIKTPPVGQGVLPGTSRGRVIELAVEAGLSVQVEPVTTAALKSAQEVFVTSSTLHIAPAVSLDGVPLGAGDARPVTTLLQHAFGAQVQTEIESFRRDHAALFLA